MSARFVVVLVAVLAGGAVLMAVARRPAPVPRPLMTEGSSALLVLHSWDERRATAYAHGSAAELRDLYVPGSAAGRADLRVLAGYQRRALRVTGMHMQVLSLSVLQSRPGWRRVQVTDRLVGAAAVGGQRHVRLPRDLPSTRTLTMMRGVDGRWRVAAVANTRP